MISGVLFAEDSDWQFNGQIQSRTEADGTDFNNETYMPIHTSLRTRINVSKEYSGALFFAQLSDSRLFGSSGSTMNSTSNLDIHQAYVKMSKLFDMPMNLQLGRFEMAYGTQRFIGAVGWHYVGRAFDGARFTFDFGDMLKLDVFSTVERESVSYKGNPKPHPADLLDPKTHEYMLSYPENKTLHGLWAKLKLNKDNKVDVFAYMEGNRVVEVLDDTINFDNDFMRTNLGLSYWGTFDKLSIIFESAYQMGTQPLKPDQDSITGIWTNNEDQNIAAYTVSLQAKYNYGDGSIGLGMDMLSGTDSKDSVNTDNNSYSPSFGTNHKFYGHMDYFISENNTGGSGLNDLYLMFNHKLSDKFNVGLNAHLFMTNQAVDVTEFDSDGKIVEVEIIEDGLPTGRFEPSKIKDANMLGQEFDLMFKYKFNDKATITWGNSFFMAGDVMVDAWKGNQDISYWTYLMITANF